mgnify:CR=1 FL=1
MDAILTVNKKIFIQSFHLLRSKKIEIIAYV